jgi:2'-5' RNA ligase
MAAMTRSGQSALIVEVPEAEPAMVRCRQHFDASAGLGVPAHITVLAPFLALTAIGPAELAGLERLLAPVRPFRFLLSHTDWFGEEVLWLGPRDPAPFRALTAHVHRAFPDYPPFGGRFDDVVPHLTLGQGHPVDDLRAAEQSVQACLPIDAQATAVTLITQRDTGARWARAAIFRLGGPSGQQ